MSDRGHGGLTPIGDLLARMELPKAAPEPSPLSKHEPPVGFDDVIRPDDIGYTHPVFLQCFLPTRHTAKNRQRWQTDCGRASLVIRAGELVDPARINRFKTCAVPAGPKARFVVAYVNDFIQREKTPHVDMGRSLRKAMETLDIPIGGRNGEALTREVENFAAAEIVLGLWDKDGSAHQKRALVADEMSFWIEKNPDQNAIWQPEMTVSAKYFDAVRDGDRLAPFYWPAMIGLQHDTRAMDIHAFLVYRLRNGLKHKVILKDTVLHSLFGQDVAQLDHFWPRFLQSFHAAHKWYPKARVEIKGDCIILKDSPSLIPYRKIPRIA